jgi:RND family efflux transporter MFP subunit
MRDPDTAPIASGEDSAHARQRRSRSVKPGILFYLFWLLLVAGVGAALFGVISRREARIAAQEVAIRKEISAGLPVRVVRPTMSDHSVEMTFPADVRAHLESPIYAKVAGYLRQLTVDRGDRVEAGQLLAMLENPEAEQEYRTAQANLDIAKITNDRNQDLVRDRAIAQQAADRSKADYLMAQSNLQRLKVLLDYQQLRAPFSGIVVARNYDPGVLVPATTTSASSSSVPVLVIAKIDRLRVFVYVPQADAAFIRIGDPAVVTLQEFPGRLFHGRVTRFTRALDVSTRTMLTEIELPNQDRAVLPGMYAQVKLTRKQPRSYPIVPDEALVFQNEKVFVPVITPSKTIHLQPVTLGFDNGTEVQITAGLKGDESIALGVGQTVTEGMAVQPVVRKEPSAAAPGALPPPAAAPPSPAGPGTPPSPPASPAETRPPSTSSVPPAK